MLPFHHFCFYLLIKPLFFCLKKNIMADITVWISEDLDEGDYFDFDVDVRQFHEEMSDSEKKEMASLLLEEGKLQLSESKNVQGCRFTQELLSVFNELIDTKHLNHLRISNEIRSKYL